jgi:hypothetical protein
MNKANHKNKLSVVRGRAVISLNQLERVKLLNCSKEFNDLNNSGILMCVQKKLSGIIIEIIYRLGMCQRLRLEKVKSNKATSWKGRTQPSKDYK